MLCTLYQGMCICIRLIYASAFMYVYACVLWYNDKVAPCKVEVALCVYLVYSGAVF